MIIKVMQTIAFLFIFLSESETYYSMKKLLDDSISILKGENVKLEKKLRWHYTLTEDQFRRLINKIIRY